MKTLLSLLLLFTLQIQAEIKANKIMLDTERQKTFADALTFTVGESGHATIQYSTGDVFLEGCSPETAAIVFWKKAKTFCSEKGLQPTHLRFGKGKKAITVNVRTGKVKWSLHKLTDKSKEFWDQVVLMGRKENK